MDAGKPQPHSHLFTLRIWDEVLDGDQSEWRGKLQNVRTGEVRYLRDWSDLSSLINGMLPQTTSVQQPEVKMNEALEFQSAVDVQEPQTRDHKEAQE